MGIVLKVSLLHKTLYWKYKF